MTCDEIGPRPVFAARMTLGEGPAWDDRGQRLWWVDIDEHRLWSFGQRRTSSRSFGEPVSAVIPRRNGGLAVVCRRSVRLLDRALGLEASIAIPIGDSDGVRLNDAAADPAGRLWVGSMRTDGRRGLAQLFCLDPEGRLTVGIEGLSIANGLGWDYSATTMYFIDTPSARVDAYAYEVRSGQIGERTTFADIAPGDGKPDGLTVDADGCLWVALWNGGQVRRYAPTGQLLGSIRLPVSNVTSCVFGGPDLNRLYITTARRGLSPTEEQSQPHAGRLFVAQPGVSGRAPLRYAG